MVERTAYIGLGGNLGDRKSYIDKALNMIADAGQVELCRVSDIIETAALVSTEQPKYLNAVAELKTTLSAPELHKTLGDIESKLGIQALNIYGLTEIIGPGVAQECQHKAGMHIWEDHFLVEIIDPNTGEQLPYGKEGELVITTLTKEAQPILRFRTKDITSLLPEKCECGRTMVRMSRITGRSDDMIRVRGVSVFPSQIESVLLTVQGIEPQYMIVVDKQNAFASDELEIWVEVSEGTFSDEMAKMTALQTKLQSELDSVLGIRAKIKLVEPKSIARSEGKAKRVFDRSELPKA